MADTILIGGYGPGISDAVARKFGAQGYAIALVGRTAARLDEGVKSLTAEGIKAAAFSTDLSDSDAVKKLVVAVREKLGPIGIVQWNAYARGAADLTKATAAELQAQLAVSTLGLVAAVQGALGDLKDRKGSVLITCGGLSTYDPRVDAMAVDWGSAGLAIAKAAQHKLAGLLHQQLKRDGIYVGEIVVMGAVKGTEFDRGNGPTLDPNAIASKFWDLHSKRDVASVNFA